MQNFMSENECPAKSCRNRVKEGGVDEDLPLDVDAGSWDGIQRDNGGLVE